MDFLSCSPLDTDINGALMKAADIMMKDKQAKKSTERSVSMIILLTDGMPNSGAIRFPSFLISLIWLGYHFNIEVAI